MEEAMHWFVPRSYDLQFCLLYEWLFFAATWEIHIWHRVSLCWQCVFKLRSIRSIIILYQQSLIQGKDMVLKTRFLNWSIAKKNNGFRRVWPASNRNIQQKGLVSQQRQFSSFYSFKCHLASSWRYLNVHFKIVRKYRLHPKKSLWSCFDFQISKQELLILS